MEQKRQIIRDQFWNESEGTNWENSQGEPDIDYVHWLEDKLSALSEVAPKQEQEENELSRVVGEFIKKESSERGVSMDDLYLCFDEYQNEVDIYYDVEGDNKLRYIDSKK